MPVTSPSIYDIDPSQLVTGGVGGWGGGYHTLKNTTDPNTPSVPITVYEIIERLRSLEAQLDKGSIKFLVQQLSSHIANTDNPHKVTWQDLEGDILQFLYTEYQKRGGALNYNQFKDNFYRIFHIATVNEILQGTDPNALITVAGIQQFIQQHNTDPRAHADLFAQLTPGVPPRTLPVLNIVPAYHVSMQYLSEQPTNYTSTTESGYVEEHTFQYTMPVDYRYTYPTCPLWEPRTNYLLTSRTVDPTNTERTRIQIVDNDGVLMDGTSGPRLIDTVDTEPQEHKLTVRVPHLSFISNTWYTLSFYYRAHTNRYLWFRLSHPLLGVIGLIKFDTVRRSLVYDSSAGIGGTSLPLRVVPHIEISPLTDTARYGISWYTGNYAPITMDIVFSDSHASALYRGRGDVFGTLSLIQLEQGIGMSPYIPTSNSPSSRNGVYIRCNAPQNLLHHSCTYVIRYTPQRVYADHPLIVGKTEDHKTALWVGYVLQHNAIVVRMYNRAGVLISEQPLSLATPGNRERYIAICRNDTTTLYATTSYPVTSSQLEALPDIVPSYYMIGYDGTNYYNGYISKFLIYNNTLTSDELQFLVGEE